MQASFNRTTSGLAGKVALITGGATGIGESTARLFCRHGAKVVIADVQDEKGRSVCSDIGDDSASFVHCDVTSESDVQAAIDSTVNSHGKLDVMFNNAGIIDPWTPEIVKTERSDFYRVMSTNVIGSFLGTKHATRAMIPQRKGSIIITASVASVVGGKATYPYTCSKHAVVGLTKDAAAELGRHGIRVNCVSPWFTPTSLSILSLGEQLGRAVSASDLDALQESTGNLKGLSLKKEDVANAVLFLASDDAKYVSGHNLVIDGGYHCLTNKKTVVTRRLGNIKYDAFD